MTSPTLGMISNTCYKEIDTSGDIPIIILIHGNSSKSGVWKNQLQSDRLSRFPMLALDLPGHGASPRTASYSFPEILEILKTTIEPFERVVLVGHSLGGHLALELLPHLNNCIGLLIFGTPPVKHPLNLEEAFMPDERMALLFKKDMHPEEAIQFAGFVCKDFQSQDFDVLDTIKNTDPKFREAIGASVVRGDLADEANILGKSKIPVQWLLEHMIRW